MIRKNATLTGIVISILLLFGIFTGTYLWLNWNAENSGVALDPKYSNVYQNLSEQQASLDTNIQDIRDSAQKVTEPTSIYQVAIGGLKGILYVLKLPFTFIDTAISSLLSIGTLAELPSFVKTLMIIAITVLILFVIIAMLKGEARW